MEPTLYSAYSGIHFALGLLMYHRQDFSTCFFYDMSTTGLELISELLRLTHRLQKFDAIH